jgi:hypothetical protein
MKDITSITNKETIDFLEPIMNRVAHIFNPCPLDIPGIGNVTATSMVLLEKDNGEIVEYFSFKNESHKGRILRNRKGEYYIE